MKVDRQAITSHLERWAEAADQYWYPTQDPGIGTYSPGYIHWGIQSNWNYLAALATLAAQPGVREPDRWRKRALASLRFALSTHLTGTRLTHDGKRWGHGWISMLGIERAMHGAALLEPHLTNEDQASLRAVLTSECDWMLNDFQYKNFPEIVAAQWNSTGRNAPESNIWSGCLLWRTAQRYPDHPNAPRWEERAHQFLLNGASNPSDAHDSRVIAGKAIQDWHIGANFFPNFALDHHGYLNIGYMVICLSNAAILHFDLKAQGKPRPASLDHHLGELWQLVRRCTFSDGRLARIGGDSRVRYAYCQEYLLPALLYAADQFGDPQALSLLEGQIGLIEKELHDSPEGFFYSARLPHLKAANPHYYARLESDRACVLAMLLNYEPLVQAPPPAGQDFETAVAGEWCEPEHGAVLSRSTHRLASFAWRAHGLTQAMCQPPQDSSLAEWSLNLAPVVRFLGDEGQASGTHRRLTHQHIETFPGGFVTAGSVMEGVDIRLDEGATLTDLATSHIAFSALPDGRTCLGIQLVKTAPDRAGLLVELKGLHYVLPNDLFNDYHRSLFTQSGEQVLSSPSPQEEVLDLNSRWAQIDKLLGIVALYGGESLEVVRSPERRAGKYRSLWVEEICLGQCTGPVRVEPGKTLLDVGFAVLAGASASETVAFQGGALPCPLPEVRGVWAAGADGIIYALVTNFSEQPAQVYIEQLRQTLYLAPGEARLASAR